MATWNDIINLTAHYTSGVYEKVIYLDGITKPVGTITFDTVGSVTVKIRYENTAWETITSGYTFPTTINSPFIAIRFELATTDLFTTPYIENISINLTQAERDIFFGVVGIPESPTWTTEFVPDRYKLQLQSGNALLMRRTMSEAYQDKTVTEIIIDIFDKYISGEGITLGSISTVAFTYDTYVAQRKYVADVLDEIAQPVGATWTITPDKRFVFRTREDFTTITAPSHIAGIKKTTSGLDQRTVQIIAGARSRTSEQTLSFTWEADQNQIVLGFPLAQEPIITINGTAVAVGVKGIQGDDPTRTFLWANNSEIITVNGTATVQPATGDAIVVTYYGFFEIEIENANAAKIDEIKLRTGSSGRIEKVETDSTIETFADGSDLADNLLSRFGDADEKITCVTEQIDFTDLLTVWTFALPDINITGDYIITERSITKFDETRQRISVTLRNKQYYLKYGEVYHKYDRNIRRLSVRRDVTIVKPEASYIENLNLDESWEQAPWVFYPTASDFIDPVPLIYPLEVLA